MIHRHWLTNLPIATYAAEGDPPAGDPPPQDPPAGDPPPPPAGDLPPADEPTVPRSRLDRATAEKWAERRRAEAAEAQLNLLNSTLQSMRTQPPAATTAAAGDPQPPVDPPALPPRPAPAARPPVTPEALNAMAAEIAENNAFAEKVKESIAAGQKDYADFTDVAARLQPYGELPRPFVEALLESGKSHHVLYALANDTSEADRILSIKSPVKQALEVAKFASTVKEKAPAPVVSAAPKPAAPKVGGGANLTPSVEDTSLSMADWMALREKQVAAQPRRR